MELHQVLTEDGYLLEVHRLPAAGKPPVILMHGLFATSADYVLRGPNVSLAFLLHDRQYDVWLMNCRGNRYSRHHATLDPDAGSAFWQYSMHEIGVFDLAATVDYVLHLTEAQKLFYVGHSMGTSIFWILLSERPEYNAKFHLMQALSPVAFLGHLKSGILRNAIGNVATIASLLGVNGIHELASFNSVPQLNFRRICQAMFFNFCAPLLNNMIGPGLSELPAGFMNTFLGHNPAGASFKQLSHFAQLVRSGRFAKYDYGEEVNRRMYANATTAPAYELDRCRVPVALHYGTQDNIVAVPDVQYVRGNLTGGVVVAVDEIIGYNHLAFLYADGVRKRLYRRMVALFDDYRRDNDLF